MTNSALPPAFADLERFVSKWDKPGTNARYAQRLASSMEVLRDFHDAVLPRVAMIKTYLDGKSFADYTDADRRLARLVFAWVIAAEPVNFFKQVRVPDSKTFWDFRIETELS